MVRGIGIVAGAWGALLVGLLGSCSREAGVETEAAPEQARRANPWRLVERLTEWDAAPPDGRRAAAKAVDELLPDFELVGLSAFEAGGAKHEIAVYRHRPTGMEFSLIPGWCFLIARTEVTQEQWYRTMKSSPSQFAGADNPVEQVTWTEAAEFCMRSGLALPTAEEWNFACRGGAEHRYAYGDEIADLKGAANIADACMARQIDRLPREELFLTMEKTSSFTTGIDDGFAATAPVGRFAPNAFGLFDMHGNVFEWTTGLPADAPPENRAPNRFVILGGSFLNRAEDVAANAAAWCEAERRMCTLGFRPVKPLPTWE